MIAFPAGSVPPALVNVTLARQLAAAPYVVPCYLLLAASAELYTTARQAEGDAAAHPGRRGNPALCEQAAADRQLARQLREDMENRSRILRNLSPEHRARWADRARVPRHFAADPFADLRLAMQVEAIPPLGPCQWAVLVQVAPTFTGSVDALVQVARVTVPDEAPLDGRQWQAWARRASQQDAAAQAASVADAGERAAAVAQAEADALRQRLEEALASATHARLVADLLRAQATAHRSALNLSDHALGDFEAALWNGATPAEALAGAAGA